MIKGSILQGYITILSVYALNHRVSKYLSIKLTEVKPEMAKSTIIVVNINTHL